MRLVKITTGLALLGVLLASALGGTSPTGPGLPGSRAPAPSAGAPGDDSVVAHCASLTRAEIDEGPDDTMAMVRTPAGEVRIVSFERGWAVYNGRAPGTFLAVCQA